MKNKKLFAISLLIATFSFVSGTEVEKWMDPAEVCIDFKSLETKINYIMVPPASFLDVFFYYDPDGST